MKRIFLALLLVMSFIVGAFGADELSIATGNQKSTYAMMIKNLTCCPVKEYTDTTGGFDNVNLLMTRKVNMGIVPEDVLEMMARSDSNVKKRIRALCGLHFNTLHIIVLKEGMSSGHGWFSKLGWGKDEKTVIQDLRDLRGKKIACFGSAIVTGEFLNERLQAGLQLIRVKTPGEGTEMLRKGEAVALFATAGWPIGWVETLDPKVFTLASLDEAYVKKLGEPYKMVKLNYPQLNAMNVVSAAPRNIIAVWNYKSTKRRQQLLDFKKCLEDNLLEIQEADNVHPSWSNVNLNDFSWLAYGADSNASTSKAKDDQD